MRYGEPTIKRTVPLAIGLLSISNPQLSLLDTLSKYSHDPDLLVAQSAVFAMGLIGAGTNHARLALMLRNLASYYAKQPESLFVVRVAQGLVQLGKGTIALDCFHTDRSLMSPTAIAGLMSTLLAFTNIKDCMCRAWQTHFTDQAIVIMKESHWLLYCLTPAMSPRFLLTLDEELNPLPVTVRVGQAVNTIGQAGNPRAISGFQTHQTPVRSVSSVVDTS